MSDSEYQEIDHNRIKRAAADDPHRCQATASMGQCPNMAIQVDEDNWTKYCQMHSGNHEMKAIQKENLQNYQLTKFHAQLQRHSSSANIKSLRDEIGILRMMLEERLNQCKDTVDLMMYSNTISDMILKIERVVVSCHKLEGSMGELLDKKAILQFAQEIITIITIHLKDQPELLEVIANEIVATGLKTGAEETVCTS